MCPSGAAYISVDCCFCEPALLKSTKRVDLVKNGPYHHFIDNQLVMAMNFVLNNYICYTCEH